VTACIDRAGQIVVTYEENFGLTWHQLDRYITTDMHKLPTKRVAPWMTSFVNKIATPCVAPREQTAAAPEGTAATDVANGEISGDSLESECVTAQAEVDQLSKELAENHQTLTGRTPGEPEIQEYPPRRVMSPHALLAAAEILAMDYSRIEERVIAKGLEDQDPEILDFLNNHGQGPLPESE